MTTSALLNSVSTQYIEADGVRVFCREAGDIQASVILLIHGYPSSSHQYHQLIPLLAKHYRVIAGANRRNNKYTRCADFKAEGVLVTKIR